MGTCFQMPKKAQKFKNLEGSPMVMVHFGYTLGTLCVQKVYLVPRVMVHFWYTLGTLWVHFFQKVYLDGCTLGALWVLFGCIFPKKCTMVGYTFPQTTIKQGFSDHFLKMSQNRKFGLPGKGLLPST